MPRRSTTLPWQAIIVFIGFPIWAMNSLNNRIFLGDMSMDLPQIDGTDFVLQQTPSCEMEVHDGSLHTS